MTNSRSRSFSLLTVISTTFAILFVIISFELTLRLDANGAMTRTSPIWTAPGVVPNEDIQISAYPYFTVPPDFEKLSLVQYGYPGIPLDITFKSKNVNHFYDPHGLYFPNEEVLTEIRLSTTQELLNSAVYKTDHHGHRLTIGSPNHSQSAVLNLGCSFVFGDGLSDDETFSSALQKINTKATVVNLGKSGLGPHTLLDLLKKNPEAFFKGTQSLPGVMTLTFIDDHIRRVLGSRSWLNSYVKATEPWYELEHNQLVRRGRFLDKISWRHPLALLSDRSFLLNRIGFEYQPYAKQSIELAGRLIIEIHNLSRQYNPNKSFVVIIYPGARANGHAMAQFLSKAGVDVIDFSPTNFYFALKGRGVLKEGGHPSALGNHLLAAMVERQLTARNLLISERHALSAK